MVRLLLYSLQFSLYVPYQLFANCSGVTREFVKMQNGAVKSGVRDLRC